MPKPKTPGPAVAASQPEQGAVPAATISSREAITRKIRTPLSDRTPVVPPPIMPPDTPPPRPPALTLPTPRPVAVAIVEQEVAPETDVSKNIHLFPVPPSQLTFEPAASASSGRYGAIIVALVVMAGTGIDIFLWRTCGQQQVLAPSAKPAAAALPSPSTGTASGGQTGRSMAVRPARSHIEISVQAERATLSLDGKLVPGKQLALDVPVDHQEHVLEVAAPGFAPFRRTISFAKDIYLTIELQRVAPATKPAAKAAPATAAARRPVKVKTASRADDFAQPFVTATRRSSGTIDETDPYSP